jgi:hypothetical protein
MTHDQAELMRTALAGSYEADHDAAVGACLQAADELDVAQQALLHGANDALVASALIAIATRLRAAARLVGDIDLAIDADDEKPEAAQ